MPPNDPAALGEALADLVTDPDAALAMGAAGRAKVERGVRARRPHGAAAALYAEAGAVRGGRCRDGRCGSR